MQTNIKTKPDPGPGIRKVLLFFFSSAGFSRRSGKGEHDTPGEPSLESEIKKRSQITSRSGIHNNKPAIYLPVSGLPPGEATGSQKWLRSINIPFFSPEESKIECI